MTVWELKTLELGWLTVGEHVDDCCSAAFTGPRAIDRHVGDGITVMSREGITGGVPLHGRISLGDLIFHLRLQGEALAKGFLGRLLVFLN